jgi:FkbM family methyltransferase
MKEAWKQQWENVSTKPNTKAAQQWHTVLPHLKTQPKVFIDIGAGEIGSEAWEVKKTNPDCIIIGFEPQPERFKILKQHNYPGILVQAVINNIDAIVDGYMGYPEGKSDFWLFAQNQHPDAYKKIKIESYTLDNIEKKYGPFHDSFLWADVEGSELSILQGATRLFNENKIIGVNVEVRKTAIGPGACTENEIISFMKAKNFIQIPHNQTTKHYDIIFIPNGNN